MIKLMTSLATTAKIGTTALLISSAVTAAAIAQQQNDRPLSCGAAPKTAPAIPDGATSSVSEITAVRKKVIAYSKKTEAYLTCKEERIRWYASFMTPEQQTRWDEDIVKINDGLRALQIKMNEEIRNLRKARQAAK